jgi:ATP-dependent Clp protease ATP-binding subunit ClpC
MFERYTEGARRVLFYARFEASQRGESTITAELTLLGLVRERKGISDRILRSVNVSYEQLARELETGKSPHEHIPTSVEIPFSQDAKDVLQLAAVEADDLKHRDIGTEHLLLALLRKDETRAAAILRRHGLTLEGAREQLARIMSTPAELPPELGAVLKTLGRPDIPAVVEHLATLEELVLGVVRPDDPDSQRLHEAILERLDAIRRLLLR